MEPSNYTIVAIGGGEIGRPGYSIETEEIDREIIRLSGKKHPNLLFIPTASGDSDGYCQVVENYYGKKLHCKVDYLKLIKEKPSFSEIEKKIMSTNIVYVGGGNTLRMLKLWRKYDVDTLLEKAAKKGIILSGVSAGAICWFKYGNSDSMKFGPKKSSKLIKLKGLGLINSMACPHYDAEKTRRPSLMKMVKKDGRFSIALQNCSALEIIGDKYRVLTSKKTARAYKVSRIKGKVVEQELPVMEFRQLEEILWQ
jgi:dipeptidase E